MSRLSLGVGSLFPQDRVLEDVAQTILECMLQITSGP